MRTASEDTGFGVATHADICSLLTCQQKVPVIVETECWHTFAVHLRQLPYGRIAALPMRI